MAVREGQTPTVACALGLTKSCAQDERRATALCLACEHGIERCAIQMPPGIDGHVDVVVVERLGCAPHGGRAVRFAVALGSECLPHANGRLCARPYEVVCPG